MLRISSIRAFCIKSDLVGGPAVTKGRREPWGAAAEVAGPMSRYPRYKRLRASWRPAMPAVGDWDERVWGVVGEAEADAVAIG